MDTIRRWAAAGALALVACSGGGEPVVTAPPPPAGVDTSARALPYYYLPADGGAWETVAPAALGWDAAALDSAVAYAGAQHTTALVVLYRGRIVAERYWRGWTPATTGQVASAGKGVAALLVGGLAAEGRVRVTDTVSRVLGPGWSRAGAAAEQAVTVRHLLSMTSGLDDSLRAVAPAGSRFYYNNSAYFKTFDVIARAAGRPVQAVMREQLSARIGLPTAEWRPVVQPNGAAGFRLWLSAREMARVGSLVASGGRWAGAPAVADTAYLAAMLAPQGADNAAYGYFWWLNGQGTYRLPGPMARPAYGGPLIPSAPPDLAGALGKGDKKIYVSRALGVVVVRHGADAGEGGDDAEQPLGPSSFDDELWRRLRAAMRY